MTISHIYRELVPFTAMFIMQVSIVGLNTLFKAASVEGMSYLVFMAYSYYLSALVLAPLAFLTHRKTELPPFNFSILWRILILAILGIIIQLLSYKGLEYSTPVLSSSINNITPIFTFALALIFRMEKVDPRSLSSQAKIIGSIITILGAFVVVLYKGPRVLRTATEPTILLYKTLKSFQSDWVIGGLLMTAAYLFVSIWYIVQAQTVRKYPAELVLVCLYIICEAIIATPLCLIMEPKLSAWKISTKMMLITVLYSGLYGSSITGAILIWVIRLKGPVYVALFTPVSIAIAEIMSVIFLGDPLYLGSVVGAIIISVGFYVVTWGNVNEDMDKDYDGSSLESPSPENVPMLQ